MVTASHIAHLHIQRVLVLATLVTYFAPMLGSVESGLHSFAEVAAPSQAGVTIAYEVFNASPNAVELD